MPITTKAGPMPTHQRLRTDDGEDVQDRREPSVELDEKPTVGVRQPRPTLHLAPQNNQLLPERCILRLKSALRLEWRSQNAQHKEDQRYHAARIADSLTPPTRMRFSAHTGSSMNLRWCESPSNAARIAVLSADQTPTAIIGCPHMTRPAYAVEHGVAARAFCDCKPMCLTAAAACHSP